MSRPGDPNAKIDLLRAAEAVFIAHGLEKARVEDITALAGRSKGSFYLHFESKEDVFRQIVETLLARLATCIDEPPPESGGGSVDLAALLERSLERDIEVFEFLWQNRRVVRLLLSGGGSSTFGYLIDEFAERAQVRTKDYLTWGVAAGAYREGLDAELVSVYISGAYDRVARHLVRLEKKPDLRAWLQTIQETVLRGIGTEAVVQMADSVVKKGARRKEPGRKPPGNKRNRAVSVAVPLGSPLSPLPHPSRPPTGATRE